jgi:hypothetical protein
MPSGSMPKGECAMTSYRSGFHALGIAAFLFIAAGCGGTNDRVAAMPQQML